MNQPHVVHIPNHKLVRRGFTLVEMMISVALVLVLMLAITQIFSITSKTIGGGQAIATGLRDAQAVQTVIAHDLENAAPDGACFVIRNLRKAIPRNATDALNIPTFANESYILSEDIDQNGVTDSNDYQYPANSPSQTYSPLAVNHRNHRQDFLMFCARGIYPRLTGNPGTLVSEMSSREAVVFYHHLQLPNNDSSPTNFTGFTNPGEYDGSLATPLQSNPNNYYPNQWILGRVAMLLVEPNATGNIFDRSGPPVAGSIADQNYYPITGFSASPWVYPFYNQSSPLVKHSGETTTNTSLQDARYDLIGMSIASFKNKLIQTIADPTATAFGSPYPNYPWWRDSMNDAFKRFRATPFASQPLDAKKLSQSTPIFLPACSQFVVEFAGDFVTQNWDPVPVNTLTGQVDPPDSVEDRKSPLYGSFVSTAPDGRIDTVYSQTSAGVGSYRGGIRWYGLPRDTDGDGQIRACDGDVVPVRAIAGTRQKFEKAYPNNNFPNLSSPDNNPTWIPAPWVNYNSNDAATGLAGNTLKTGAALEYTVAWGPAEMVDPNISKPKMIRITVAIDRPEAEGKLPDGQVFEYVFKVGQ